VKGLILSGGKGSRLRPITHSMAKQLVPVANKPVLFYGLEAMRDAGITDVGIVVGDTAAEIRAAVGTGSAWGLQTTYVRQRRPLGLAHAVAAAHDYLGDSPFLMYLGDNLIKSGVSGLVREFERERPNAIILLSHVPNPQEFGVAVLDGGRVVSLEEKPARPKSDLALVGVYLFDSTVHEVIRHLKPSFRNELEITDAIQGLIDRGLDVRSHVVSGWWKDTGTVEAILEANRLLMENLTERISPEAQVEGCSLNGAVVIEKGAVLEYVTVQGPVMVGVGCRVERAEIAPFTAISEDCELRDCSVGNSILMSGCRVLGPVPPIRDSLIGSDVLVEGASGVSLVLGDSSRVQIPDVLR
jgi:glucose-1-phosphate thymidylyltransferase